MTGRRLLCSFLVTAILLVTFPAAEASAAGSIPVIVKLTSSSGLLRVLNLLDPEGDWIGASSRGELVDERLDCEVALNPLG